MWIATFVAAVGWLGTDALWAGDVARVSVDAQVVGEPTWHNYGTTYRDAQGRTQTLNMPVPFFPVTSIKTTVLVALNDIVTVTETMQVRRANRNTDLIVAATVGDLDRVKALLSRNVMVNAENAAGSTALMGAAAGGYADIVALLLEKGARANARNRRGYSALMLAARNGHEAVVGLLLAKKAEVNLVDADNNTALLHAVNGGQNRVVEKLVSNGARIDYANKSGISPLSLASARENLEVVSSLTKSLASLDRPP